MRIIIVIIALIVLSVQIGEIFDFMTLNKTERLVVFGLCCLMIFYQIFFFKKRKINNEWTWLDIKLKWVLKLTLHDLMFLKKMSSGLGIIFITDKVQLLKVFCDQVYLFENGIINKSLDHEELLSYDNIYRQYWTDLEDW